MTTKRFPVMTRAWLVTLTLSLGAAACGSSSDPAPAPSADALEVAVDRVEPTPMSASFEAGGVLVSRHTAEISSRVMAPIVRVLVRPGERVRRGLPLVELDAAEVSAQAARARAGLEGARANARVVASDREAAEAGVALARATHTRIAGLHAARSATTQELDQATAALRQAEARLAMTAAQAEATSQSIEAADAASRAAAIAQTWSVLTSPLDGTVAARHADPGSMATPGQPLLVVEASGAWQMDVRVDASRVAGLAVGQTANVRVDGSAADAWVSGRISEIARVDPSSHSFLVTVDLDPNTAWRSGLFGRARFAGPAEERLTVAAEAMVTRGQLTFVYVVGADDHARLRSVSLGDTASGRIEVLAGLAPGDRVVLRPAQSLLDGAKVRVTAAPRGAQS
ncbi:MAG TPA: efflux RND transporter periplasmic adaptor subunit [Vicinamibacterales bacterium]|nr:efflux RND transporter periplasmic adaptor subunit [Vicinamibacterales bacterium]